MTYVGLTVGYSDTVSDFSNKSIMAAVEVEVSFKVNKLYLTQS